MDEIDEGLLEALEHYLRGASATNKTYSRIAGTQLREGNPEVINQYLKNLKKIENHSIEIATKRENLKNAPTQDKANKK